MQVSKITRAENSDNFVGIMIIISLFESTAEKNASPIPLYACPSAACLFLDTLTNLPIASLHLGICLFCLLVPFLGCHSVTQRINLLFFLRMTCPAHIHFFFFFFLVKMPSTLVCSLIPDVLFLSLHVIPNIILSFPLWLLRSFLSRVFVRLQVSDPYVIVVRRHWLYTFLFSDNVRLLFITLCYKSKGLHPIWSQIIIVIKNGKFIHKINK